MRKTKTVLTNPHFKVLCFFVFVSITILLFSIAGAEVRVEFDHQSFASHAETKTVNGKFYVNAEELFQELGGTAYYTPILKKINLYLRGKIWILSLDKKTMVSGETELPLPEKEVLLERNVAYLSFALLERLFGITVAGTTPSPVASPSPTASLLPPGTKAPSSTTLLGIRFASYPEEVRTRITFDFRGNLPPYSQNIDRATKKLEIVFTNCTPENIPAVLFVNDGRINRIETKAETNRVVVSVFLKEVPKVNSGKLPEGERPRIYFDVVSLIEAATKPITPSPVPQETPKETIAPEKSTAPTPTVLKMDRLNPQIVVIDPGHGGRDPGCVHNGYAEKDIVLKVALLLRDLLEKEGFQVFLTRSDDSYPSLTDRYNLVNEKLPLVLVSIHCNASPNPAATGVEIFVGSSRPKGEGAQEVADRENELFLAETTTEQQGKLANLLSSAYYLTSREASSDLGVTMLRKITALTGQNNRGLKEAPLVILRNIYSPACLVEIGFLSNAKEAKNLASAKFQAKIAQGMAEAIKAFSQSEKARQLLKE